LSLSLSLSLTFSFHSILNVILPFLLLLGTLGCKLVHLSSLH
uniref:Uncharacterized protein n=1 Tax=Amphimedon queenslandica TaxID=400682 RepID=A0A1X7UQN6_AMPQE